MSPNRATQCLKTSLINQADFSTLKAWDLSVPLLKNYGEKANFLLAEVKVLSVTFEPVDQLIPNFKSYKICMIDDLFGKAVCKN